jgi:uncharacterized membrane protein
MNKSDHKRDIRYSSDDGHPWEKEMRDLGALGSSIKRSIKNDSVQNLFSSLINFFKKTMTTESSRAERDVDAEDNRVLAAIGYIWILCLVPLFMKRHSKFAQFHARQGAVLFLAESVGFLVFWIPLIGWLIFIAIIGLALAGFINAWQGRYWEMPILGKYARKINM